MSASLIREVAFREIRTRSRTKAFRWITLLLVLGAVAGPIVAAIVPDGNDDLREVTIGVVVANDSIEDRISAFAVDTFDVTFADLSGSSTADVDQALADGEIDLALEPGPTVVWNQETDFAIANVVYGALQQEETLIKGRALGLDGSQVADLLTSGAPEERFADRNDEGDGVAVAAALIGLMGAFVLPQVFGQLTLLSVVEEKSTRVIEVLLNHLPPRTLLLGKVLGVGALAVTQLVVVVGGLTAALLVTDTIEIPSSVWRFIPILVVSVIGGLAIYNTLFALLGSLISRQEDASQVMLPVFVPIMGGYLVGQAAIFGDADTVLTKVLTFIPFTAPMLLPVRVARDAIAPWEIVASLALILFSVWLLVRIAGRVYEFTLLHTGSRVGWGQLIRLSRGAAID